MSLDRIHRRYAFAGTRVTAFGSGLLMLIQALAQLLGQGAI